jgi:hypothetical protein
VLQVDMELSWAAGVTILAQIGKNAGQCKSFSHHVSDPYTDRP